MPTFRTTFARLLLIAQFSALAAAPLHAEEPVSFKKDIAPILVHSCQACHGPKEAKSKFRIDTFDLVMKPGSSDEPSITPGKPDASELYRLLVTRDEDERMPKKADALPAAQAALVKKWIEQGAKFDGPDAKAALVDYLPRVEHPAAPATYAGPLPITALAFSPDGKTLAVSGYHEVLLFNPETGELVRRIGNIAQRTYGLAYSKDGHTLAVAGGNPGELGEVRLFNPNDGKLISVLLSTSDVVFDVKYSRDEKLLAACGADNAIRIFEMPDGRLKHTITNHSDWVMGIAFNHDATQIASASRDKTAKVFDLKKAGDMISSFSDHNDQVDSVAFAADDKQVFSSGRDRRLFQWNVADGKKAGEVGLNGEGFEIALEGETLLVTSSDRNVRRMSAKDRGNQKTFSGHKEWVYSAALHEGTKRAASGGHDGEVRIWKLEDGATVTSFVAAVK
ncbi:MAG: c-type cytochrome domain-containing protein [Phycisphaeraceae bacterium]